MTYGSLFTGIGGLDLGLDRAGFQCRWQVEIDPYAVRVLEKHWPHVKRYGDITKINGDELEPVDLVCGGFPCQDLSQAGKRAGIEGARSGLWFEYARLVGVLRPRFVLIENVPGLLVPGAMSRVVGELARLGYVGIWRSLRASEFGASHLRKRIFIVAYRDGAGFEARDQFSGAAGSTQGESDYRCTEVAHTGIGRGREREIDSSGEWWDELRDSSEAMAYRQIRGLGELRQPSGGDCGTSGTLDHATGIQGWTGLELGEPWQGGTGPERTSAELADSQRTRLEKRDRQRELQFHRDASALAPGLPPFAPGPSDPRWPAILRERPDLAPALAHTGHAKRKAGGSGEDAGTGKADGGYIAGDGSRGEPASPDELGTAPPESQICRMADGIPDLLDGAMSNRTKRLGRLGNAVVPQVAEWIGRRILEVNDGEECKWQ